MQSDDPTYALKILWQWVLTESVIQGRDMPDKWICDAVKKALAERLI